MRSYPEKPYSWLSVAPMGRKPSLTHHLGAIIDGVGCGEVNYSGRGRRVLGRRSLKGAGITLVARFLEISQTGRKTNSLLCHFCAFPSARDSPGDEVLILIY